MFYRKIKFLLAIVGLTVTITACNSTPKDVTTANHGNDSAVHWSYEGETGPENWYKLNSDYAIAKDGTAQSPINIITADSQQNEEKKMPELHYTSGSYKVNNNGHTIELVPDSEDNYIMIEGTKYTLKQAHFHAPSEHQLDGVNADMEVHFVHKDEAGNIAVIGVMMKSGAENSVLKEAFSKLPAEVTPEGEFAVLDEALDLSALIPVTSGMYFYDGSLTTPPCTEGVNWNVCKEMIELSPEQIDSFKKLYDGNNRPVQELNDRIIYSSN